MCHAPSWILLVQDAGKRQHRQYGCWEKHPLSDSVGQRLREERRKTGLNQEQLGAIGDVSRHSQAEYEAGKTHPNTAYLNKIAKTGVDVCFVLTGRRVFDSLESPYAEAVVLLRRLDDDQMKAVMTLLDVMAARASAPAMSGKSGTHIDSGS
jgi:transcriptional regulator with XRE-family HTH domain